jgi:hypothetical protein
MAILIVMLLAFLLGAIVLSSFGLFALRESGNTDLFYEDMAA